MKKSLLNIAALSAISSAVISSFSAHATIVEFDISVGETSGKVQVNLYDNSTPVTVANFLSYVNDNSYENTIFHRAADKTVLNESNVSETRSFIVQGGGFTYNNAIPLSARPSNAPIRNEPVWSNVAGTIAMAKTSDPNSATRQWFFNMDDNSESLDIRENSGGFTVFGQVISGMDVLTSIATANRCFYEGRQELPFIAAADKTCNDYVVSEPDADLGQLVITQANFVTVNSINIIDDATNTIGNLTQVVNPLLDSDGDGELNIDDNDDDGDGVNDSDDLYPFDPRESADTDEDGVPDNTDIFPNDPSETVDFDEDGTGDNADLDDDNDGYNDDIDAFPFNDSEWLDTDGDGVGDNSDEFLNDASEWRDLDKDGVGDNADACPTKASDQTDSDGDGYCDETEDSYPNDANEYIDTDGDGIGDNADNDDDGDGVNDDDDYFPKNPNLHEDPTSGGDGGGSLGIFGLLSIGLIRLFRKIK